MRLLRTLLAASLALDEGLAGSLASAVWLWCRCGMRASWYFDRTLSRIGQDPCSHHQPVLSAASQRAVPAVSQLSAGTP